MVYQGHINRRSNVNIVIRHIHKKWWSLLFLNCKVVYNKPSNFKCQGSLENYVIIETLLLKSYNLNLKQSRCFMDPHNIQHASRIFMIFLLVKYTFISATWFSCTHLIKFLCVYLANIPKLTGCTSCIFITHIHNQIPPSKYLKIPSKCF